MINFINDAPTVYSYSLQDNGSYNGFYIELVYDYINYFIWVILIFIIWVFISIIINYRYKFINNRYSYAVSVAKCSGPIIRLSVNRMSNHNTILELIWTIVPVLLLSFIAVPSFKLLYLLDEVVYPVITVKAIGRQWYWSFEYNDNGYDKTYDSYLINESNLILGDMRLLEVSDPLVLPVFTNIRVLATSSDVIHSLGLSSLSLKLDAIPGRLNQNSLYINRFGTYYGSCFELCGVNHAFMPIIIEATGLSYYIK